MSRDRNIRSISDNLVLDDSEDGVVITGVNDDRLAAKSGLQAGDELVAATIQLDKLNKNQVRTILKALEPYEDSLKVVTKKDLSINEGLGSLDINGKILGDKISVPSVNGGIPNLSLNSPQADVGGTIPGLSSGLTGLGITTDAGGLKAPDISVATPELNTRSPTLNIEKPQIKGGLPYKAPKFSMPNFDIPPIRVPKANVDASGDIDLPSFSGNVETPDLQLSAPVGELKSPDLELNGPKVDLNAPNLDLEGPDVKAPSGNIKWPHLNLKGPKVKGPEVKGDLDLPDVDIDLPKANIDAPNLDVKTPNIVIDKPTGKLHWPHKNWGKPKLHRPKADLDLDADLNTPDVNLSAPGLKGDISAPDVDLNLPKADLTAPDLEVNTPNIDASNGIKWPHLRWKKGKMSVPKADLDVNADLGTPDLDLSAPKLNGPSAELQLPECNLDCPDLDVQSPKINAEPPSGKIVWPHQKLKKHKLHLPKAEVDGDLNTPDVDFTVPNIDGKLNTPDIDLSLPKADLEAPELPSGKIKFPTFKKHTLRLSKPKIKTPDLDIGADVNTPDFNVNTPDLNLNTPDLDVNTPDLNFSPNMSLDAPKMDLDVPNADVEIKAPDANLKAPSYKGKWPTLKKPKWLKGAPKVNGPDIDADVSGPTIDVPDASLNLPTAEVDLPKVEANTPDIEAPSGLMKWFKAPKANLDADVKVPDVDFNAPSAKVDGGIEAPKIKLPKMKGLKVKGPDLDADVDAPNIDLKPLDLSLSTPSIDGSLDALDLKGPNIDIQAPNIDSSQGKFKLPKLKLPKLKGHSLDVDSDLKTPDLSLDAKMPKADLKAGDLSLKAPDVNFNPLGLDLSGDTSLPDLKLASPEVNLSKADFQVPDLSLKQPSLNLTSPNIDGNLAGSKIDANLPKVEIEVPNVAMKSDAKLNLPDWSAGNSKLPDVNLPNLDLSSPGIEAGGKAPGININTPSADADFSVPDLNISGNGINDTKVDVTSPRIDGNIDKPKNHLFKFPKINFPGSKSKAPELDISAQHENGSGVDSDAELSAGEYEIPAFIFHRLPKASSLDGLGGLADTVELSKDVRDEKDYVISKGIRLPIVNQTPNEKVNIFDRLQRSKEKIPSANASPTDDKPSIDLKLDANASLAADSVLVRGDTFKVEKPESTLGLVVPEISTSENSSFSQSISNMLGLSS